MVTERILFGLMNFPSRKKLRGRRFEFFDQLLNCIACPLNYPPPNQYEIPHVSHRQTILLAIAGNSALVQALFLAVWAAT